MFKPEWFKLCMDLLTDVARGVSTTFADIFPGTDANNASELLESLVLHRAKLMLFFGEELVTSGTVATEFKGLSTCNGALQTVAELDAALAGPQRVEMWKSAVGGKPLDELRAQHVPQPPTAATPGAATLPAPTPVQQQARREHPLLSQLFAVEESDAAVPTEFPLVWFQMIQATLEAFVHSKFMLASEGVGDLMIDMASAVVLARGSHLPSLRVLALGSVTRVHSATCTPLCAIKGVHLFLAPLSGKCSAPLRSPYHIISSQVAGKNEAANLAQKTLHIDMEYSCDGIVREQQREGEPMQEVNGNH